MLIVLEPLCNIPLIAINILISKFWIIDPDIFVDNLKLYHFLYPFLQVFVRFVKRICVLTIDFGDGDLFFFVAIVVVLEVEDEDGGVLLFFVVFEFYRA